MQLLPFLLAIAVSVSVVTSERKRKWDSLRVTWGKDLKNPNFFVKYPTTEREALLQGFRQISDCDLNAQWRGKRYVNKDDFTVVLLFDINGFIAGIQTTVLKNLFPNFPSTKIIPPFVDDGDRWAISAYFIDPSIICTTGRSAVDFAREGTGTNLYIQNGTIPESSTLIPPLMTDISKTMWTRSKCMPWMGLHYYYNLRTDLPCDEIFPATILYNDGELTVFAWVLLVNMPSERYEHSETKVFPYFMDPVPTCMYDLPIASTMHIYLTDNVTLNQC